MNDPGSKLSDFLIIVIICFKYFFLLEICFDSVVFSKPYLLSISCRERGGRENCQRETGAGGGGIQGKDEETGRDRGEEASERT